jgi:hypothetical protein
MASSREQVEEAYAGDIIGLPNHGNMQIGDSFSEGELLTFTGIPYFAPDLFRVVRIRNPLKIKQLHKGLQQLGEEGAVQVFKPTNGSDLILGAVGVLQFEVVASRLLNEYGVDAVFEGTSISSARWVSSDDKKALADFEKALAPFQGGVRCGGQPGLPGELRRQPAPDPGTLAEAAVPCDARACGQARLSFSRVNKNPRQVRGFLLMRYERACFRHSRESRNQRRCRSTIPALSASSTTRSGDRAASRA